LKNSTIPATIVTVVTRGLEKEFEMKNHTLVNMLQRSRWVH